MANDRAMSDAPINVHATCIRLDGSGVLLRGATGSGKSDLALRLIAQAGAELVADDQCLLARGGERLVARPPSAIAGRIEARGLGVLDLPQAGPTPVALIVDLKPAGTVARLPSPETERLLDVEVPRAELDPFEAGAVAKLRLALSRTTRAGEAGDIDLEMGDSLPDRSGSAADGTEGLAPPDPDAPLRIVLVTGISGAGRSSVLKALEDIGYEAIDNLPLHLLSRIVQAGGLSGPVAIGVDIRSRSFAADPFLQALASLRADPALDVTLVFVDCEDEVLRRRYTETRRRHPLAQDRPVTDGIAMERRLVAPLLRQADLAVDTSTLSVRDLRQVVASQLGLGDGQGMVVFVTSFSYKHGLPREADLVFDTRFLRNPHYDDSLRPLTGRDREVARYVAADPDYDCFLDGLREMLRRLLPRYAAEGKSYLTIAVGCTGGRHRSVAVAESLSTFLRTAGWKVILNHRELALTVSEEDVSAAS